LNYNLSVSESWGRQKTSQEDGGGMSFKPQGRGGGEGGMMLQSARRKMEE
jgi:hypothetical protein